MKENVREKMDDDDEMQEREKTLGGKIREDINLGGRSRTLHVQLQTTLVLLRSPGFAINIANPWGSRPLLNIIDVSLQNTHRFVK